ncbi:MAG: bifunctional serine/threonine-protein kinase/formylglycine-generating enzyme family protein, partial [Planctomycetota bacterium]
MPLPLGLVIGNNWRITDSLGLRGGWSFAHIAEHAHLPRRAFVKQLAPRYASDPRYCDRFVEEARGLSQMESPFIVRVYDVYPDMQIDGHRHACMVLEYLHGQDLRSTLLAAPRPLDPWRVLVWGEQILQGLAAMHAADLVHRDIKPDNLMLVFDDAGEFIKIVDFGIVADLAATHRLTHTGGILGTPGYIAPEIEQGHPATPLSDLWSLGQTLRELMHNDHEPLPGPIDAFLARLSQERPRDRFTSAEMALAALAEVSGRPAVVPPAHRAARSSSSSHWPVSRGRTDGAFAAIARADHSRPGEPGVEKSTPGGVVAAHAAPLPPPPARDFPGFTFLCEETFSCENNVQGTKRFTVPVYRCDAFARAIGPVGNGARAIDAEFVLLPPPGYGNAQPVWTGQPFLIARTCVSQRVYDALGGQHYEYNWPGPLQPANQVSWRDAQAWFQQRELAAAGLRLPGEAEWEFACRAGTQTAFCFGDGATVTSAIVNFNGNHPDGGAPKSPYRERTVE